MREVAAMAATDKNGFDAQRWVSRQLAWEELERALAEEAEPADASSDEEHSAAYEDTRSYGRLRGWQKAATAR